jgi:signal transduction histidine kinase
MLGMTPEQLSFKRIVEIIAPADREIFLRLLEEVEDAPDKLQNLEIRLTHAKGQLVPTICLPRYSYLEKATFCVFHDISLRKEAERIRAEVFAMVTHDLRAPVASFDAFLEFAEMGKLGVLSDAGKRLLPAAEHSVTKMKQLLNDILNLEKIKSGAAQVQSAPVSVDEILAGIGQSVLLAAEKRSVQIAIKPSNVIIVTDRERLEQVLLNFLSNALKFAPPGSKIDLFCHRSSGNGDLYISVKDEGPGIKPDEINSVFDRFYEGTKGDSDLPSSGLGLAICQEVARLLGARLDVQSTLGKGSTFSVIFPKERCK